MISACSEVCAQHIEFTGQVTEKMHKLKGNKFTPTVIVKQLDRISVYRGYPAKRALSAMRKHGG